MRESMLGSLGVNVESMSVKEFYRDGHVLVTGGTGFVGKVLVEKLLRSCPGIAAIYLLIRPKRGLTPEERCNELLQNPLFDRLRNTVAVNKLKVISGDMAETGMGISESDRQMLTETVTVVFHSAATVKFNETLDEAVRLNTMSTRSILEFSKDATKLKAVVHVSTAFSNPNLEHVGETVYQAPADAECVIQCVKTFKKDLLESLGHSIMNLYNHPNTYTVTKSMAENLVEKAWLNLPVGIVRPSIITGAWKEPYPGWVDNTAAITWMVMEIGRGTVRSILCKGSNVVDVIPVDIVANSVIVAAWHIALQSENKGKFLPVYNCTSGEMNPITWGEVKRLTIKHSIITPSRYVQWYPGCSYTTNRVLHVIRQKLLQRLPAYLLDKFLMMKGAKPWKLISKAQDSRTNTSKPSILELIQNRESSSMEKLCRRMEKSAKSIEHFFLNEFQFGCSNQQELETSIDDEEQKEFYMDISNIDWDEYMKNWVGGIRKFVLNDPPSTVPDAKKKLNRLWWFSKMIQVIFLLFLIKFLILR